MDGRVLTRKNLENKPHGSLYIPMYDIIDKRKSLLLALKSSLLMQEEYDKILKIRKAKVDILKTIKKEMEELSSDYQDIRKVLPSTKNILSSTEKEINELESHILSMKDRMKYDQEDLNFLNKVRKTNDLGKLRSSEQDSNEDTKNYVSPKSGKSHATADKVSKIDRVKNNLKVIEEKLKQL